MPALVGQTVLLVPGVESEFHIREVTCDCADIELVENAVEGGALATQGKLTTSRFAFIPSAQERRHGHVGRAL